MSIGFLTLDIIILLVIYFGTFAYSFNTGKKPIVKLLLSVYPALLIFQNLPFVLNENLTKIGIFLGIYLVIYKLMKRNFTAPNAHTGGKRFMDSFLISLASVFTLLIIYYKILPLESLYQLKLPFSYLITETIPFYITMLIPILIIVFTNRRDD